jgi:Co/Zn/Cd efflux system component
MFLHVLADTLGSAGVIFSSFLIYMFGWTWADPLCSIFIAVLISLSAWPLLKESGEILLLRSPRALDKQLKSTLEQVGHIALNNRFLKFQMLKGIQTNIFGKYLMEIMLDLFKSKFQAMQMSLSLKKRFLPTSRR